MVCSCCEAPTTNLVKVYFKCWADVKRMKGPSYLCGKCLIGWTVPAIRPDRKRWEFGKVENYNELTSEHSVRFRNEKVYSVIVDEKPFEEYVRSYTMVKSSSQSLVVQEPKGGHSSEEESSLELENCTMMDFDWARSISFDDSTDEIMKSRIQFPDRNFGVTKKVNRRSSSPQFKAAQPDPFTLKYLATAILNGSNSIQNGGSVALKSLRSSTSNEQCERCGLIIFSSQTGRRKCERTGWCETCTNSRS